MVDGAGMESPPLEHFDGTVWAFGGPVFVAIFVSTHPEIVLAAIGMYLTMAPREA